MPGTKSTDAASIQKRIILGSLPVLFTVGRFLVDWVGTAGRPQARRLARRISRPISALTKTICLRSQRAFFELQGWSDEKLRRLYESYQVYMARLRSECAACLAAPRARILRDIEFVGMDHLDAALRQGRGVMLVGTHFGTWWHAPVGLGLIGAPIGAIFNSFPLYSLERYLVQRAWRVGIGLTVVDKGARESIVRASRDNKILYLTLDVPSGAARDRDWIDFGPTLINVNPGPAILASRERMPVLYAQCEQIDPCGSRVRIVPAEAGPGARPSQMRAEWASHLLREVLRKPEQWWAWGFIDLKPAAVRIPPPVAVAGRSA